MPEQVAGGQVGEGALNVPLAEPTVAGFMSQPRFTPLPTLMTLPTSWITGYRLAFQVIGSVELRLARRRLSGRPVAALRFLSNIS